MNVRCVVKNQHLLGCTLHWVEFPTFTRYSKDSLLQIKPSTFSANFEAHFFAEQSGKECFAFFFKAGRGQELFSITVHEEMFNFTRENSVFFVLFFPCKTEILNMNTV